MAYVYRGRRTAYDNIAAGSVAGKENTISMSTVQDNVAAVTDVSLYNPQAVSQQGTIYERLTAGSSDVNTDSNLANAAVAGIEDTENSVGDKLTSDGETITDTPSVD